jgi:hypothetical protein
MVGVTTVGKMRTTWTESKAVYRNSSLNLNAAATAGRSRTSMSDKEKLNELVEKVDRLHVALALLAEALGPHRMVGGYKTWEEVAALLGDAPVEKDDGEA